MMNIMMSRKIRFNLYLNQLQAFKKVRTKNYSFHLKMTVHFDGGLSLTYLQA